MGSSGSILRLLNWRKNIVYTDNNPLTYLNKQKKLPAIEQRWANALAPFDLDILYRSAKRNDNADARQGYSIRN